MRDFSVADDSVDNHTKSIKDFVIDESRDYAIDTAECPYCHGFFGVDWTYMMQVTNVIHCPMCCMEVIFEDWE